MFSIDRAYTDAAKQVKDSLKKGDSPYVSIILRGVDCTFASLYGEPDTFRYDFQVIQDASMLQSGR